MFHITKTRFASCYTFLWCRNHLQNTFAEHFLRLSRTIVGLCGSVWGGAEPNRFLQIPPAPKQVCRKPPLCLALTNCRNHTICTTLQSTSCALCTDCFIRDTRESMKVSNPGTSMQTAGRIRADKCPEVWRAVCQIFEVLTLAWSRLHDPGTSE